MSWDSYKAALSLKDSRGAPAALSYIEQLPSVEQSFAAVRRLKAIYSADVGRSDDAIAILIELSEADPEDYWSRFSLFQLLSKLRRYEEAQPHMRKAHAIVGWRESVEHGYVLTDDYFSPNIPRWTSYFADLVGKPNLRALEIGSWQGGSASWMLDKVLTAPDAQLTCIDTFEGSSEHAAWIGSLPLTIEELFNNNIQRTGAAQKVNILKGYSQAVLRSVTGTYDLIYIDGAHEAKYVIQDATLCWPLLRKDSLLLFDDYRFTFPKNPDQNTALAIDFFIEVMKDEIEVLDKDSQVLIRKKID